VAEIKATSGGPLSVDPRNVSVPLMIGIVLAPYIFAWFLLRQGYSKKSRVISFSWLAFLIVINGFAINGAEQAVRPSKEPSKVVVDPNSDEKAKVAMFARQYVRSGMKDPASADFGNVWGMSSTVACGFVNGKNSFGAFTGEQKFIFANGAVAFQGSSDFSQMWNTLCVSTAKGKAPSTFSGISWGGRPTKALKQLLEPTSEGLSLYGPVNKPEPLEGVAVSEADYSFDQNRLFSTNFYIDGTNGRDAILTAFVKMYGAPQEYDEGKGHYAWKWSDKKTTASIDYNKDHDRTTVNFGNNRF